MSILFAALLTRKRILERGIELVACPAANNILYKVWQPQYKWLCFMVKDSKAKNSISFFIFLYSVHARKQASMTSEC